MIYNLVQYLRNKFPSEVFYPNIEIATDLQGYIPTRRTLVIETGGTERPDTNLRRQRVQILTRDVDSPNARDLAYDIYEELNARWGLILPQITVDSVLYGQIETAEISSIQLPSSIGVDSQGRAEYSFNFIVIWEA